MVQQHGVGVDVRVGGVEPVDVRQQDQQIRIDALGDDGRQRVVVADAQLLRRHGVVLVDDGHGAQLQQAFQGVGEIAVALRGAGVVPGDEQLGHRVVIFPEQLVVNIHQLALSHRRRRLLGGDVLRTGFQAQFGDPHADGAGGDQDHLMRCVAHVADGLAQRLHAANIQMPRRVRQGRGADFDDAPHTASP